MSDISEILSDRGALIICIEASHLIKHIAKLNEYVLYAFLAMALYGIIMIGI